jgi:hypothetical protein
MAFETAKALSLAQMRTREQTGSYGHQPLQLRPSPQRPGDRPEMRLTRPSPERWMSRTSRRPLRPRSSSPAPRLSSGPSVRPSAPSAHHRGHRHRGGQCRRPRAGSGPRAEPRRNVPRSHGRRPARSAMYRSLRARSARRTLGGWPPSSAPQTWSAPPSPASPTTSPTPPAAGHRSCGVLRAPSVGHRRDAPLSAHPAACRAARGATSHAPHSGAATPHVDHRRRPQAREDTPTAHSVAPNPGGQLTPYQRFSRLQPRS